MTISRLVYTPVETAEALGVTLDRLQKWRSDGHGPRFLDWGRRTIRYRVADIEEWVRSQRSVGNVAEKFTLAS